LPIPGTHARTHSYPHRTYFSELAPKNEINLLVAGKRLCAFSRLEHALYGFEKGRECCLLVRIKMICRLLVLGRSLDLLLRPCQPAEWARALCGRCRVTSAFRAGVLASHQPIAEDACGRGGIDASLNC
jgi:hypothetical protein